MKMRRGRKGPADANDGLSDSLGMERIDLDSYDFDGFAADINELIDLPSAAQQVIKWALGVPIVITVVAWGVFSDRMSSVALVPFAALVLVLSLLGAAMLGVFVVARRRVDQTTAAAGRVVELVGMLHRDFERVKADGVAIPIRDVGAVLASEIVFPLLFGAAGNSTTLAGPMGFILRPTLKIPMRIVERKVVAALEQLPTDPEDSLDDGSTKTGGAAIADLASATEAGVTGIAGEYERVQQRLEQIVGTIGVVALGPVAAFLVISFLPLAAVLFFGWQLT